MSPSGVIAVITIMLALIVQGALEYAFTRGSLLTQSWSDFEALPVYQLVVFFILTFRFYLGALRFGQTEPEKVDFFVRSFNFVFSFLVFSVFYVTALTVTHPDFYTKIIILHAVDAVWFGLLRGWSTKKFVDEPQLKAEEIPIEPVQRIMVFYFVISVGTAVVGWFFCFGAAATVFGWLFFGHPLDSTSSVWRGIFLIGLIVVSAFDFWTLRDYYFYFGKWKETAIGYKARRSRITSA